jgi:hypothetical protein
LTKEVKVDWIKHFIKDPQQVIASGDKRAGELMTKYKVAMPSFASLKENEVDAVVSFLKHTSTQQKKIQRR